MDDLVWATYEGKRYPGRVQQVVANEVQVTTMVMLGPGRWKWPDTPRLTATETTWYKLPQVSSFKGELAVVNNRGHFTVK